MTRSPADAETAPADRATADQLAPAVLAARVAALAENGQAAGAGALPVWDRVAEPRRRVWLTRCTHFAAWCVSLGLLALAALRITYHDAAVLLIWLNAYTLYVYLPAYLILLFAVWRRRWLLTATSVAVVAFHLAWVAPDFRPAVTYHPPIVASEPSQPIRIFYANVRARNRNLDGIINEIGDAEPDVVVLVEINRPWFDALQRAEAMKPYVYGTRLAEPYMGEVMVFSKLPVELPQRIWAVGRVCNLLDIPLAGQSLRLFCLHSPRPHVTFPDGYEVYWEQVAQRLAEEPRPLVVIGDFNATQHSLVLERLTAAGLRSAHEDRGRGYATTWPNGHHWVPPIRIDQVLVSPDVECLDIAEGVGAGSDHKPLILDVRLHAGGGTAPTVAARRP